MEESQQNSGRRQRSFIGKVGRGLAQPFMITSSLGLAAVGLGAYYGLLGVSLGALLPQAAIVGGAGFVLNFLIRKISRQRDFDYNQDYEKAYVFKKSVVSTYFQSLIYFVVPLLAVGLGVVPVTGAVVGMMNYMCVVTGVAAISHLMNVVLVERDLIQGKLAFLSDWMPSLVYYGLQASVLFFFSQRSMEAKAGFPLPSFDPLTNITLLLMANVFQGALMAIQYAAGYGDDYGLTLEDRYSGGLYPPDTGVAAMTMDGDRSKRYKS